MNYQRQLLRRRTCKMFSRANGEHGDMAPPLHFPVPISTGLWGPPFGKVKEGVHQVSLIFLCVCVPGYFYFFYKERGQYCMRCYNPGRVANRGSRLSAFHDLDDPDHWIKWEKLCEEDREGKVWVGYQGTNYLASYLWKPGDPQPDLRRREPPESAHH